MGVPVGGRPHHDDDAFGASILNVFCDGVEGAALECDGRRLVVYQTGFFLAHSGVAADFASVLVLAAALVCVAGVFVVRLAAAVFVFATYDDEAGEGWVAIDYCEYVQYAWVGLLYGSDPAVGCRSTSGPRKIVRGSDAICVMPGAFCLACDSSTCSADCGYMYT